MLHETIRDAGHTASCAFPTSMARPCRAQAPKRQAIGPEVRRALDAGRFLLHYQPRIELSSGLVSCSEALIRWPDRRRGMIPPGEFIPVAERSDLINGIGAWVLHEACAEAMRWAGGRVSVNVSARQLQSGVLPGQLASALEQSGLAPERLELELIESMLVDNSMDTLLTLSAIRDLGVGLALDDFGTGYASLSMLKRLPLTVMKLDRSLVRELPANREDAAIVRAVIETGHAIGLTVVAEGIETEAQRAFLSGIGCDQGQGYLFSRPVPAEQVRIHMSRPAQSHAVARLMPCGPEAAAPASGHANPCCRHRPGRTPHPAADSAAWAGQVHLPERGRTGVAAGLAGADASHPPGCSTVGAGRPDRNPAPWQAG